MSNVPGYVRPGGKSYVSDEGIIYCTDGKLRWVYELDQRKCPTVLLDLLWKYAAIALVVGALFLRLPPQATLGTAVVAELTLVGAAALAALVVFGVRLLEHGRFICLVYTLDEQVISCQQIRGKTNKEYVTHAFAVWVGGQSQPAVRTCKLRQTPLACVRSVVAAPARNRLRLRGAKGLRTVFVAPRQLPVVLDCLTRYCPEMSRKRAGK